MTTLKPVEPVAAATTAPKVQTAATAAPPPVQAKPQALVSAAPVSVVVTKMPEEKHDYSADVLTGGIGVFGGLIGAVVGAAAAYRLNLRQAKKAKNTADVERLEYLSFAILLKLRIIYDAQLATHRHIEKWIAGYEVGQFPSVSLAVPASANTLERVKFEPEEVMRVGKFVSNTVLNILFEIDSYHNTTMDMTDAYRSQWMEVQSYITPVGSKPGGGFIHKWTPALELKLRPRLDALDSLLAVMRRAARRDTLSAFRAITDITQARLKAFQPDGAYEIEDPSGQMVVLSADGVKPWEPAN